jgi:hypothetical protein
MEFFAWDIRAHVVWSEDGNLPELGETSFPDPKLVTLSVTRKPFFVQKDQKLGELYGKMGYKGGRITLCRRKRR